MTNKAAKRLIMPSHPNYFLHIITIEVVEETECEPIVLCSGDTSGADFQLWRFLFFRAPT
jgi:hypothetical protein